MSKSKFKNTEELEKAYKELEKEFTKKSQKLAEVQKTNYVTLLHNEMDNLLNDYAKRRISDLEAKLVEKDDELLQKEKKIQDLMLCEFVATTLDFNKLSADNCRLREQLADIEANKEKEINRICKTHIEANAQLKQQLAYQEQKLQFVRKLDDATILDILQKSNQDKISFAVEQLEKVKNRIESKVKNIEKRLDDLNIKIVCESTSRELGTYEETVKIINNQIKRLKEGE